MEIKIIDHRKKNPLLCWHKYELKGAESMQKMGSEEGFEERYYKCLKCGKEKFIKILKGFK